MFRKLFAIIGLCALLAAPAQAATDFLQAAPGTAVTFFTSTEMASLASGASVVSTTGCTSGVCTQASFSTAGPMWVAPFFKAGASFGGTPVNGATIACWFVNSSDAGTTYEKTYTGSTTQSALGRNPDFIFAFGPIVVVTSDLFAAVGYRVLVPAGTWKLDCQNLTGFAFGAGNNNNVILVPTYYQY